MEAADDRPMTLAFSLAAVERLADPSAVFADARRWSRHVGIVDHDFEAIDATVAAHDLEQDFAFESDEDKWLALERIQEATATPRHVYVGATDEDRRVASQLGWEYLSVREAAEKADWTFADAGAGRGLLARLLRAIGIGR